MNFIVNNNGDTAGTIRAHGIAISVAAQNLQAALIAAREVTNGRNYQTAPQDAQDIDIRRHEERVQMALACDQYGLEMSVHAMCQEP